MAIAKLLTIKNENMAHEIEAFFTDRSRGSENTSKAYRNHVYEFFSFFNIDSGYVELETLTTIRHMDVLSYVSFLEDKGNKSSTIESKLAAMISLWKFLAKDYGTNFNPYIWNVTLTKEEENPHPEFTQEEFDLFLDFASKQQCKSTEKYLYFKTLFITGIRQKALLDMRKENIKQVKDITGDMVWTIKVKDKGSKYDVTPISDEFYKELSVLLVDKAPTSKVFDINIKSLYKCIKQFKEEYGIEKDLVIHSIKSTSVTEAFNRTGDIKIAQEQGHHSDPSLTMKKYIRSNRSLKSKMSYKMDSKVDTKSLEDLTKEQLLSIINKCSDETKTEILKYVF